MNVEGEKNFALAIKNPPAIVDLFSTEREAIQAINPFIKEQQNQSDGKTKVTLKDFCIKLVDMDKSQAEWKIVKDYSMHGLIPFTPEEYHELYKLKQYADLVMTALKLVYENKTVFPHLYKKIYTGKTVAEIRHDEATFACAYMDAGVIDYKKGANENE